MKKRFLLVPVMLASALFIMNISCVDNTSEEVCESFDVNVVRPSCQASDVANSCCEGDNCYYEFNGVKYECDGDDCTDAQLALLAVMCPSASSIELNEIQISLQKHTSFLLEQTRLHSLKSRK